MGKVSNPCSFTEFNKVCKKSAAKTKSKGDKGNYHSQNKE
jgi:hypothetical protein